MAAPFAGCMAPAAVFNHQPPIGLLQRVPVLAKSTGWTETAVRIHLMFDPCFNIAAAGAILLQHLREAHGDLRWALAFYHSHKPSLNQRFRTRGTMPRGSGCSRVLIPICRRFPRFRPETRQPSLHPARLLH